MPRSTTVELCRTCAEKAEHFIQKVTDLNMQLRQKQKHKIQGFYMLMVHDHTSENFTIPLFCHLPVHVTTGQENPIDTRALKSHNQVTYKTFTILQNFALIRQLRATPLLER